jgi:RNA polymerase sigma factor (sigma-70 family)
VLTDSFESLPHLAEQLSDTEVASAAFAFMERRHESIVKLCRWAVRGTKYSEDEALSECAIRSINAVLTYDPSKANGASFDTHALGTLRYYLIKLFHTRTPMREQWRKDKLLERAEANSKQQFELLPDYSALEQNELLQRLWNELSTDDCVVLELKYIYDTPLEEIADVFSCSRSYAYKMVNEALQRARELLKLHKVNGHGTYDN